MPAVLVFFFAYLLSLIKHCLLTLFHVTEQLVFSYTPLSADLKGWNLPALQAEQQLVSSDA